MRPIPLSQDNSSPHPGQRDGHDGIRLRLAAIAAAVLFLLLLVVVPPLLNVSRFQRRIARNISASLGRPVHLDRVSLNLLPLPGFTLTNFVVEEDPTFGSEPILRANEVRATLRLSSLWGHRVEFSTISLTEPHVNLVHLPDGRWNLQSILLQAARIEAAPTDQRFSGPAPRFPYIEATSGRLNLKLGEEKSPYSLTEADFALWLPEPHQWHLRLEAHPARTDIAPADTGTLRVEATLGGSTRAATLDQVPLDLHLTLQDAQVAGLSRLLLGRDDGLRGDLNLSAAALGTLGANSIVTHLQFAHLRRADFVPPGVLAFEIGCQAKAASLFHAFTAIECHLPPASSSDAAIAIATGSLPDVHNPRSASGMVTVPALPIATILAWLRAATPRPPTGLMEAGSLSGTIAWNQPDSSHATTLSTQAQPSPHGSGERPAVPWFGELEISGAALRLMVPDPTDRTGADAESVPDPIAFGDILLRATPSGETSSTNPAATPGFDLLPVALPLGGDQPTLLEGHFDTKGYVLHLSGSALESHLRALAVAMPHLGEGLAEALTLRTAPAPVCNPGPVANRASGSRRHPPKAAHSPSASAPCAAGSGGAGRTAEAPISIDLIATRAWSGPQTWRDESLHSPPGP